MILRTHLNFGSQNNCAKEKFKSYRKCKRKSPLKICQLQFHQVTRTMKPFFIIPLFYLFISVAYCISNDGLIFYENAQPEVLTFGPYTVVPNEMTMDNNFLTLSVPGNGYGLVEFTIELINADGEVIDQDYAYLHHFEVVDTMSTDEACPEKQSNLIVAAGADLGSIQLQYPYYIEIPAEPSSRWEYTAHIVNPNSFEIVVSIRTTFYYIKVDQQENVQAVPLFISVAGCNSGQWNIVGKEGTTYFRYLKYESTVGGLIVWSTGHLHRGGTDIYLIDPNTGAVYVNSRAHYNNPNHSDWITFIDILYPSVTINVNQSLAIGCEYDGSQDINGAMGFILSYVVVDEFYNGNQANRETIGVNANPFVEKSSGWSFFSIVMVIILCLVCFGFGIAAVLITLGGYFFYQKQKDQKPKFSRLADEMDGMDDIGMF